MDDLGNENVQKKPVIEWCELEFFKGVRAKASHKQQNGGVFDGWKKNLYTYFRKTWYLGNFELYYTGRILLEGRTSPQNFPPPYGGIKFAKKCNFGKP